MRGSSTAANVVLMRAANVVLMRAANVVLMRAANVVLMRAANVVLMRAANVVLMRARCAQGHQIPESRSDRAAGSAKPPGTRREAISRQMPPRSR